MSSLVTLFSLWSKLSPTQIIGVMVRERAAAMPWHSPGRPSPVNCRRSVCPTICIRTPRSFSMSAEISPVCAPFQTRWHSARRRPAAGSWRKPGQGSGERERREPLHSSSRGRFPCKIVRKDLHLGGQHVHFRFQPRWPYGIFIHIRIFPSFQFETPRVSSLCVHQAGDARQFLAGQKTPATRRRRY